MDTSPHKSGFVTVNGIQLHYLDWGGNGPDLLFLPGLGCNAHIFDRFAPRFTDRFRVLALTRRGHGESDYPETGYDIDTLTEDIRAFLDCLGIDRVILVGHSLAGIELSHFAAVHPERVEKLIYLDAAYYYQLPEYKTVREQNPLRGIKIPGEGDDYYRMEDLSAHIQFAYPSLGSIWSELFDEHLRHEVKFSPEGKLVDKMTDGISQAIFETMLNYEREDAKIRVPTLNIYTLRDYSYFISRDYMTEEQQARMKDFFDTVTQPWNLKSIALFKKNVPHARVAEFPGHHYCFIPQPEQERTYEEMRAFLEA